MSGNGTKKLWTMLIGLCLMVGICGCSNVCRVAEYDSHMDIAISELQRKVETFLTQMERGGNRGEASYERNVWFYDEVRVDLSAINVRAGAVTGDGPLLEQLRLLAEQILLLEGVHKNGLDGTAIQRVRGAVNACCTRILRLELARRRGDAVR